LFVAYSDGHLLVFSETHLDIFNTQTSEWVQSIGIKQSLPLNNVGNVVLTSINDTPLIVYLANIHTSKWFVFIMLLGNIVFNFHYNYQIC